MRITFQEVGFKRTKSGKCVVCGKRCQITKEFFQTINPFNKNADGTCKDAKTIMLEEKAEAQRWLEESPKHVKCKIIKG